MIHDDLSLLADALSFAAERHRDQRRKDRAASPYINHPIALLRVLALEAHIQDPTILCAALLHDTLEDTDATARDLESRFGPAVCAIVLEVTDDKRLPKAERKRLQIEHAAHASEPARLVKLADKICNLRDVIANPPVDWDLARRQAYFDWSAQVVARLRGTHALLETLFDEVWGRRPEQ